MKNIKLLYYDRFHISEGIDINRRRESKECDIGSIVYEVIITISIFFTKNFERTKHVTSKNQLTKQN